MLFLYLRKSKVKLLQVFKIALKIIEDLNYFDYNGKQIYWFMKIRIKSRIALNFRLQIRD